MVVPTLETPRLRLRAWRDEDVLPYCRILADWDVTASLGSGVRYRAKRAVAEAIASVSTVEARRAIRKLRAQWERCGYGEWAVEDKASGELIGQIGLVDQTTWTAEPCRVEVGFLLRRDAWGRGLASEAASAAVEHAFGELRLPRLISIALVANVRSQRVMERLGLHRVGATRWRGSDVVWYALDRDEWLARDQSRAAAYS